MIGRKREFKILRECAEADRSRLIVVYGRRRVGKTFLIREAFDYSFTFTHTGIENGSYQDELFAFWQSVKTQLDPDCERPKNWLEAFALLKTALAARPEPRKTIFIDELPWMDTRRSGFVKAVEDFWNGWATARKDIMMVVCGSAAAWMTKKVLQNRGGLFNRASRTIYLEPFTLHECEELVEEQQSVIDRKDIAAAYMIFGGAPYYWTLLERRESLSQNIDRLFFSKNAELAKEFRRLYRSVFENPEPYIAVVTALATLKIGMTREELVESIPGMSNCGTLTEILENLELSGFVRSYVQTGNKKKGTVFQLIDNYTLFYFQFVRDYKGHDRDHWMHLLNDRHRVTWEGLAFEMVCLQHADQIKEALGISGVETELSAWRHRGNGADDSGAQVDLVISRGDRVTNLCEMKFSEAEFVIEADDAKSLRNKVATFKSDNPKARNCHVTFVTTYGVKRNKHSGIVQSEVTLDDLFRA